MNYPEGLRGIYMVIIFPAKSVLKPIQHIYSQRTYLTDEGVEIPDAFYKKNVYTKVGITENEFQYILQEYERYKKFYEAIQSFMQHPYGDYREKEDV